MAGPQATPTPLDSMAASSPTCHVESIQLHNAAGHEGDVRHAGCVDELGIRHVAAVHPLQRLRAARAQLTMCTAVGLNSCLPAAADHVVPSSADQPAAAACSPADPRVQPSRPSPSMYDPAGPAAALLSSTSCLSRAPLPWSLSLRCSRAHGGRAPAPQPHHRHVVHATHTEVCSVHDAIPCSDKMI